MRFNPTLLNKSAVLLLAVTLFCSFGIFKKKKIVNPITKDTLQPDKVLFDRAVKDIEHGRYEVARLTLNTLINTYDSSEYLAKAKLAIADSWYREGGAHGLAQAEAEYKDFILFYPQMEEAAESQWKVCDIHFKQMEKVDRDSAQAQRTEDECRALVTTFPNSKYLPQANQMLRDAQEVLAQKEFLTGAFYHTKGSYPAAANRLTFVADQYPLFSSADEALWQAADSYMKMGDRFENEAAVEYTRIARDYPLSKHADAARNKLTEMKRPVPEADQKALAHMLYEKDHYKKPGTFSRAMDLVRRSPDVSTAAKEGTPAMAAMRPPTPVSVPRIAGTTTETNGTVTATGTGSDVTAGVVADTGAIDKGPDARQNLGTGATGAPAATAPGAAANATAAPAVAAPGTTTGPTVAGKPATPTTDMQNQPLPTNHVAPKKTKKQLKMEEEYRKKQVAAMQKAQADADAKKAQDPAAVKQPQPDKE